MRNKIVVENEITAHQIAAAIARHGGKLIKPTEEQRLIIESKHWGPAVVIAGAGSGKTETMSQRVLWLVANGVVEPSEILGLTFTRKAAGELASRIRIRLRQLRKAGLIPEREKYGDRANIAVEVSTYHAYAGKVLSTHGIRLGIDADAEPIGEAAAWQITNQIVAGVDVTEYSLTRSPNSVVEKVMSLSSQIGEHNVEIDLITPIMQSYLSKFDSISDSRSNEEVRDAIKIAQERLSILPMVKSVDTYRHEHGLLTFDDHMVLAARLAQEVPEIAEIERGKYKVVLLDEYQDTSQSQVRFLAALFAGEHAVTAVGDPNQAIYGWRGAAARTLESFGNRFAIAGVACESFDLLTTWRNDKKILDFANLIVDEIAAATQSVGAVKRLALRTDAGEGNLSCGRYLTQREEAEGIASYFKGLWNDPVRMELPIEKRSSFAVLVRAKAYISEIESALRELELPTEVVGLGGLIHIPEIADIISLLRIITFPDHGTALTRLLAGPRLAIGPKDLSALGNYAKKLTKDSQLGRDKRLEDILEAGDVSILEADDFAVGSIIEALEIIDAAPASDFSFEGLRRLKEFAKELISLRRELTGSITDVIQEAERFLRLDTEVLVRDGWAHGRRHLDKFLDEAANFQRTGGTLATFLQWLEVADKREGGLKPTSVIVNNEAIQILTIHSAKGAEWDVVAVPGLVAGNFPNSGKGSDSWIKSSGSIPLQLREDHLNFQEFEFPTPPGGPKHSEVGKALKTFDASWKKYKLEEEFRLAYVAFTRARSHLLCTSSIYRDGVRDRDESILFTWVRTWLYERDPSSIISMAELDFAIENENPLIANPRQHIWPAPSPRADAIRKSADFVSTSQSLDLKRYSTDDPQNPGAASLQRDAVALIAEMESRRAPQVVFLPERISVSTLINIAQDPIALALNIRRPMPNHIDPFARKGTAFHEWLERRFQAPALFGEDIFDPMSQSELPLAQLQVKWLASSWAEKSPHSVEEGFETVLAGTVVRGRIDAIYKENGYYQIIDWKTGAQKSGADLAAASIQLATYRLAYSKLHDIPLDKISAAFYYVATDSLIKPTDLFTEADLIHIISSISQRD